MKHTQGEWEVKKWADGTTDIIVPVSERRFLGICKVTLCDSPIELEANAKLIAAAPELLKAVQSLMIELSRYNLKKESIESLNAAHNAIHKATT